MPGALDGLAFDVVGLAFGSGGGVSSSYLGGGGAFGGGAFVGGTSGGAFVGALGGGCFGAALNGGRAFGGGSGAELALPRCCSGLSFDGGGRFLLGGGRRVSPDQARGRGVRSITSPSESLINPSAIKSGMSGQ